VRGCSAAARFRPGYAGPEWRSVFVTRRTSIQVEVEHLGLLFGDDVLLGSMQVRQRPDERPQRHAGARR
jgi:hypothetical protein